LWRASLIAVCAARPQVSLVTALLGGAVREVLKAYHDVRDERARASGSDPDDAPLPRSVVQAVDLACSAPARRVLRDVTAACVATAVGVYLERTANLNMTDEALASLSKPAHRAAVSQVAAHVVGDAVRASVHACHEVMTTPKRDRIAGLSHSLTPPSHSDHHIHGLPTPGSFPMVRGRLNFTQAPNQSSEHTSTSDAEHTPAPRSKGGLMTGRTRSCPAKSVPKSDAMHDFFKVIGAPEIRQLACEVVGSAAWGGVHATMECFKETIPGSWKRGVGAMPPAVVLCVMFSMMLHMSNLVHISMP